MNFLHSKTLQRAGAVAVSAVLALSLAACGGTAASKTASGSAAATSTQGSAQTTSSSKTAKVDTTSKLAKSVDLKVEKDGTVSFKDDLGNSVTVKNPQRVVACMGSFANAWELAGGKLTAATDDAYENYGVDLSLIHI